ncbi:MAG: hypothetical protein HC830_09995 [Bacteroidetes bacterium]|nr:hypothetical protein [Bacteroidota bacterium]
MQKETPQQHTTSVIQPPAPHLETTGTLFQDKTTITMEAAFDNLEIRYSLDGSEPTHQSTIYTQPITIAQSSLLTARAFTSDGRASRPVKIQFRKMEPQSPVKVKKTEEKLQYSYYEGSWEMLPDFSKLQPVKKGFTSVVGLDEIVPRNEHFATVLEGYVEIRRTGLHTFYLNSDDGSKLFLNDELIINHDGDHSAIKKTGQSILKEGKHKIRIEYFQGGGGKFLQAGIVHDLGGDMPFSPGQLSH